MRTVCRVVSLAALMVVPACQTAAGPGSGSLDVASAQFARFRALEGCWRVVGGDHAQGATHSYRTVANGSVVVEVAFAGQPHEMVTVVHLDGSDLVLTHYCAAGNQPHLVAQAGGGDEVRFAFVKAGNLKTPADAHMRDASFKFVDADHVEQRWTFWQGGEQTSVMTSKLERVRE